MGYQRLLHCAWYRCSYRCPVFSLARCGSGGGMTQYLPDGGDEGRCSGEGAWPKEELMYAFLFTPYQSDDSFLVYYDDRQHMNARV